LTPEAAARVEIDRALNAAGWIVQDLAAANLSAGPGVAVREVPMIKGHGEADYLAAWPADEPLWLLRGRTVRTGSRRG